MFAGFKLVVQTEEADTTMLGSGSPFVTADGYRDGVLWVIDLKKGLLAWDATPKSMYASVFFIVILTRKEMASLSL